MAMALDRAGFAGSFHDHAPGGGQRPLVDDPQLRALTARRDDRLLRDAGLTREDALGPQGYFWSEWARLRAPWSL